MKLNESIYFNWHYLLLIFIFNLCNTFYILIVPKLKSFFYKIPFLMYKQMMNMDQIIGHCFLGHAYIKKKEI
jgi:hypothetical protein